MTVGIVKRSEGDLSAWLATEVGFISTLCAYDEQPITLEPFQAELVNSRNRFRWITKARQLGYSFAMSLEALAQCHLRENHTAIFVSYNASEARARIELARQVYESIPLEFQKRLVVDTKSELAWESNGMRKGVSRILSLPSKAPRGRRGSLYLDELAHYPEDREVYRGSTALVLRGNGQLTGCSTPLGRRGIFWEIACEELRKFPHHWRQIVPWWASSALCLDTKRAVREAPAMTTEERVARFGKPALVQQYDSLGLDDFQQEFEVIFVDASYSFLPHELILPNTVDDLLIVQDPDSIPPPSGRLVAGFDVGRTRDRSELAVFEEHRGQLKCRMLRTFEGTPFADQEGFLRRLLETVPIARLSIDHSGIGMNLAENLARDYPQVVAEDFTNANKERWATDFKIALQRREVVLPRLRELTSQIHSIKKRVLPSGKVSFDAERTARGGHADKFWAIALACQKERTPEQRGGAVVSVRIIGGE